MERAGDHSDIWSAKSADATAGDEGVDDPVPDNVDVAPVRRRAPEERRASLLPLIVLFIFATAGAYLWTHLWFGAIWLGLIAIFVVIAAGVVRAVVDRRR